MPDHRSYYFSAQGVRVHPAVALWVSVAVVSAIAVGLVLEIVFGALSSQPPPCLGATSSR